MAPQRKELNMADTSTEFIIDRSTLIEVLGAIHQWSNIKRLGSTLARDTNLSRAAISKILNGKQQTGGGQGKQNSFLRLLKAAINHGFRHEALEGIEQADSFFIEEDISDTRLSNCIGLAKYIAKYPTDCFNFMEKLKADGFDENRIQEILRLKNATFQETLRIFIASGEKCLANPVYAYLFPSTLEIERFEKLANPDRNGLAKGYSEKNLRLMISKTSALLAMVKRGR